MNGIAINFTDFLEDDPEVLAFRRPRAERPRHIFPRQESWANRHTCPSSLYICRSHLLYDAYLFHKKPGTCSREARTGPGHAEILTRAASADDVHRGQLCPIQLGDVPYVEHIGEVFFRHLDGERLDLAGPDGGDAVAHRRQREPADPIEEGAHGQRFFFCHLPATAEATTLVVFTAIWAVWTAEVRLALVEVSSPKAPAIRGTSPAESISPSPSRA